MSTKAEDEYERRYMDPGESVLFREKVVSRAAFRVSVIFSIVFGLAGLAGLATLAVPAAGLYGVMFGAPLLAFAIAMGGLGVLFSVFRFLVTGSHLHVHFGWSKKKIPLSEISVARVVELMGFRQGKVSLGVDGVVRTWVGHASSGRGVEVTYQPEGKRKHVLTIGSDDPDRFLAAIEQSRSGARVRVGEAAAADDVVSEGESSAETKAAMRSGR